MKHIEYYYADKERYMKLMNKHIKNLRKTSINRQYYKLREYIKEGKCTVDELKMLTNIQRQKLIVFHDMKRLKSDISDEDLQKYGFDYDDIKKLKDRGVLW